MSHNIFENMRSLLLCLFATGIAFVCGITGIYGEDNNGDGYYNAAVKLLEKTPLIDGHNDLPWMFRSKWNNKVFTDDTANLRVHQPEYRLNTDIPRLRKGKVGGQFWSVFVACDMQNKDAVRATMEQIDMVHKMNEKYSDTFELALTADDVERIFQKGKIASLIGIEGGHSIDSSLGALRMFYREGVRYMTLTHTCNTPWADSCAQNATHGGLTEFGREVVTEMNRLGMLVDISHVSADVMRDSIAHSKAPVIFSHSDAYSLCKDARNVPDDVLDSLKTNGGIVMINFFAAFVNCNNNATLSQVADHIQYVISRCGPTCVGLGSDFDGVGDVLPTGLEDVSKFPDLIAELLRRKMSEEDVALLAGGNVLRVLRQAENAAKTLKTAVPPHESVIFPQDTLKEKECRSIY